MDRRDFLKSAGVVSATLALPKTGRLFALDEPSGGWRTFEVTTRVEVLKPSGPTLIGGARSCDAFPEDARRPVRRRGRHRRNRPT
ncbi:MAG: hypothetical protein DMF54_03365 [Acidobacteria bacterium]|nr:MAG: hypothetical protein DMF54_03365 [Acidobacteriota bacterium]